MQNMVNKGIGISGGRIFSQKRVKTKKDSEKRIKTMAKTKQQI